MKELLGYAEDELDVGFDTFESHLHPDDRERTRAAIEAHLKERGVYDVEQRLRTKSGEYRWFRARGQALWDEAGNPLRMVGSTTDITERKQAEAALAQERNLLRTLIDNLPDAIYVKDAESRFVLGNLGLARQMGATTPEEVIGESDFDYHPPELAGRYRADEQEILRSGKPLLNCEEPVLDRSTGEHSWYLTTKVPLRDDQGKVVGLVGIGRDITERVQAQGALRRSARRLELLHAIDRATLALQPIEAIAALAVQGLRELAPCCRADVVLLDPSTGEFTVLAVHAQNEIRLGPGARFPIAATVLAPLQHGEAQGIEDLEALTDLPPALQALQAEGMRSFVGVPMLAQDELTGLLHLAADRPAAFSAEDVEIARELADQLAIAIQQARLSEEVQRHTAELEQRVAERTAELTQREAALREANDKLKESDRFKNQFVSDVSHELRQPLTNIKSYLWLLDHGKPEKHSRYMETLNREADLLQKLIEDLLDLSRLDLGKVQPVLEPLDLNLLVGTVVEDRGALAAEHGLALHASLASALPPVMADSKRLTQVLTNLLANALNYTPRGGAITVSTAVQTADSRLPIADDHQPSRWVTFSVTDTGPGIAAEEQARIFERFYRGEAARVTRAPGTGLGLAICQELIQRHGGQITVESQVGQGSTFTVWLPADSG